MRIIILSVCVLLLSSAARAQTPTYGFADEFTYDGVGNRVRREYKWMIIAPKQNGQEEHPVDTLSQIFQKAKIALKVYPNPTSDQLVVENLDWKNGDNVVVKILDITGKLLQDRRCSTAKESFTLNGFAPGVYQVHYYLNNEQLTTWKIVKN